MNSIYTPWKTGLNPVSNEYVIHNIEIVDNYTKVKFEDYFNKEHRVKLKLDKLKRYYITYKNIQIYFLVSTNNGFSVTPAYRKGDKIISAGFGEYSYNDNIHFYRQ